MVKRTRTDIARELNRPHADQASAKQTSRTNNQPTDDIIVWLADAHENKRARQVVEWQHAQPMNLRQAV